MASAPSEGVRAVLFDLDDTLVPWQTVAHWQWAWRPMGPVLSERRTVAAIHRSVQAWDRRRWRTVVGEAPPADAAAYRAYITETLTEVAGHALPAGETEAVVGRFLKPAGEVETFPDVGPALRDLESLGCTIAVSSSMPEATARHLLQRAGLGRLKLLASADGPVPLVPAPSAYRALAKAMGTKPAHVLFVGDLFWSDVRAAARAGMGTALLDRNDWWARALTPRLRSLAELGERVRHPPAALPEPSGDAPEPGPDTAPAQDGNAP